jgi:hypothetical protein
MATEAVGRLLEACDRAQRVRLAVAHAAGRAPGVAPQLVGRTLEPEGQVADLAHLAGVERRAARAVAVTVALVGAPLRLRVVRVAVRVVRLGGRRDADRDRPEKQSHRRDRLHLVLLARIPGLRARTPGLCGLRRAPRRVIRAAPAAPPGGTAAPQRAVNESGAAASKIARSPRGSLERRPR